MKYPAKVTLAEVGLRDGIQNECTKITTDQKLDLLTDILDAGFQAVEVGSFVRPDRVPQMADTGELFRKIGNMGRDDVEFRALIPNYRGLENALASGCRSVKDLSDHTAGYGGVGLECGCGSACHDPLVISSLHNVCIPRRFQNIGKRLNISSSAASV